MIATLPDLDSTTRRRQITARQRTNTAAVLSSSVHTQETTGGPANAGIFGQELPAENGPSTAAVKDFDALLERLELGAWAKDPDPRAYDNPPAMQLELDFRHGGWHHDRMAVLQALKDNGVPPARIDRFCNCGCDAMVQRLAATDKIRVLSVKCHDRFCKMCGNERGHRISQNLLRHVDGKQLRFITLTLKHNSEPLNLQIDRLQNCFSRLRKRDVWMSNVTGAAAFLEIKLMPDGKTWHPHIHIIAEGDYIPHYWISAEWLAITGDSSIVDLRYVRDRKKQVGYAAKYASKPIDKTVFRDPEKLREAMRCLHGRRLCTMLGTWRGIELEEKPADEGEWIDIGSFRSLKIRADEGEEAAIRIIRRLFSRYDDTDGCSDHPQDSS